MESEGSLPSWLAAEIEDRCPGFLEDDSRYSLEHPSVGFSYAGKTRRLDR